MFQRSILTSNQNYESKIKNFEPFTTIRDRQPEKLGFWLLSHPSYSGRNFFKIKNF